VGLPVEKDPKTHPQQKLQKEKQKNRSGQGVMLHGLADIAPDKFRKSIRKSAGAAFLSSGFFVIAGNGVIVSFCRKNTGIQEDHSCDSGKYEIDNLIISDQTDFIFLPPFSGCLPQALPAPQPLPPVPWQSVSALRQLLPSPLQSPSQTPA
jgi:hypothetical protein